MSIKEDYEVLFDEFKEEPLARIRLTSGPWQDIIYYYSEVNFVEKENDEAVLRFEYTVVSPSDFNPDSFDEDTKI